MILNANTKKKVKVSRMVRMHSAEMEDINEAGAGDIFALFGVDCASGETFCDPNANVQLTEMHVPDPVMSLTVKNKNVEDLDDFLQKELSNDQIGEMNVAEDEESWTQLKDGPVNPHCKKTLLAQEQDYVVEPLF